MKLKIIISVLVIILVIVVFSFRPQKSQEISIEIDANNIEKSIVVDPNSLILQGPSCMKEPCLVSDTIVVFSNVPWRAEGARGALAGGELESVCFDPLISPYGRMWSICPGVGGSGSTTVTLSTMIYGESSQSLDSSDRLRRKEKIKFIEDNNYNYEDLEIALELPYWDGK
ncbi:MAG: hypothetical protein ACYC3G_04830 [Minisyncoccota bacterium]